MNTTLQFLIILLSSSVVAAIVSGVITAIMQKRNEKESRLFGAKLEAYKEFVGHLESRFLTLTDNGKSPTLTTLMEISAKCLLVSNRELNHELKRFFSFVDALNTKVSGSDYDANQEKPNFVEVWNNAEKIEILMRKDLGFE